MPSIQANTTATNHRSTTLWVGFSIVFALSLVFEVIENSRSMIDKYRELSGNSLGNRIGVLLSSFRKSISGWQTLRTVFPHILSALE